MVIGIGKCRYPYNFLFPPPKMSSFFAKLLHQFFE